MSLAEKIAFAVGYAFLGAAVALLLSAWLLSAASKATDHTDRRYDN